MKKTVNKIRPNCKVDDTLRVDSDEWSTVYPQGSEGRVTIIDNGRIWVQVTKSIKQNVGHPSVWWTPNSSTNENQATISIVPSISDEEVEEARAGLKAFLYG